MLSTCTHDACPRCFPRCMSTMFPTIDVHDACPRSMSTLFPTMHVHDVSHDACPRSMSTMCAHDRCPRCFPRCVSTIDVLDVVHDQCPRCVSTSCSGDKTDWSDFLSSWRGKDSKRGLCDWGERIPLESTRKQRWVVKGVCRSVVLKGLDNYCINNGTPTVVTGVLPPAGHRRKRKKKQKKRGTGKGFHRHTPELVPGPADETIDTLKPFIFSIHVFYCTNLDPPIPQGTLAEVAVFKTFAGTNCKNHLLRSIKTRFQVTHDMHPRHVSRMIAHDINPRHASTTPT